MSAQIIDGRAIAQTIIAELTEKIKTFPRPLTLSHFVGTNDPAIQSFIRIKRRVAGELGVEVFEEDVRALSTQELVAKIASCQSDGIIVQFPLPENVDKVVARNAVPLQKDVDVISDTAMQAFEAGTIPVIPPVAGAIEAIIQTHHMRVEGKKAVIVGEGWLVGKPAGILLRHMGAQVVSVRKQTADVARYTKEADIVVLGAGSPGLLTPHMIQKGAIVFDAGTSEEGGKMLGDADPACADVASFITPVPGGIGPITVAMIFKNLLALVRSNES